MSKFLDFYNKLNEDQLLKRKKKLKEEEGSCIIPPSSQQNKTNNGLVNKDNSQNPNDLVNEPKEKKDKEIIFAKPVFPIQNRVELSSVSPLKVDKND